jgi:hypothetical protein
MNINGRLYDMTDMSVAAAAVSHQNNNNTTNNPNFNSLKNEQINAMRANPRHLNNLIGLSAQQHSAQPNDYSTSAQIGALLIADDDESNNLDTATLRSTTATYSTHQNNQFAGHYLIPRGASGVGNKSLVDEDEANGLPPAHLERSGSRQHLYFQHMPPNQLPPTYISQGASSTTTAGNSFGGGKNNVNFNYSSSDSTDTTDQPLVSTPSHPNGTPVVTNFGHHLSSSIYNMSNRHIYTANSFGRNAPATSSNSAANGMQQQQPKSTVLQGQQQNLPPPPPSLLTSSILASDNNITPQQQHQQTFDGRRVNTNFMSSGGNMMMPPPRPQQPQQTMQSMMNTYLDHQQVLQQVGQHKGLTLASQQQQQQQLYGQHQNMVMSEEDSLQRRPSPPPPPLPPLPPTLPTSAQPSYTKSSPYLAARNGHHVLTAYNEQQQQQQQQTLNGTGSSIVMAASSTVEAMSALHVAASSNMQPPVVHGNLRQPSQLHQQFANYNKSVDQQCIGNSNVSSIKINLNGDCAFMKNVAGSRRPLEPNDEF